MMSFYGGRRGQSFNIERTFSATNDVTSEALQSINLGGYYLVQNDSQYGYNAVYKRTLDGSQFIAKLVQDVATVNPENSPVLSLNTFDNVLSSYSSYHTDHPDDQTYGNGTYSAQGGMTSGTERDTILYNSYYDQNLQRNIIGLDIPYPVIDLHADLLPVSDIDHIVTKDSDSTPFHSIFNLKLPEGKTFTNLRITRPIDMAPTPIYDRVTGQPKDFSSDNTVVIVVYDEATVNNTKTYYLGDWNIITTINFTDTSVFTIADSYNTYTHYFKEINNITYTDGDLTITYTNPTRYPAFTTHIKAITSLTYDEETSQVKVTFNDDEFDTDPVLYTPNYIKDVRVTEDDHLQIYYSDPDYREEHGDAETGWVDYGSIRVASGILIGTNYTTTEIAELSGQSPVTRQVILDFLNTNYPQGCGIGHGDLVVRYLTDEQGNEITDDNGFPIVVKIYDNITELNENTVGKIITVGDTDDVKEFYAFDYRIQQWYYIGKIGDEVVAPPNIVIADIDDTPAAVQEVLESLPVGGIWLGVLSYDSGN